jgi:hypothetical protein
MRPPFRCLAEGSGFELSVDFMISLIGIGKASISCKERSYTVDLDIHLAARTVAAPQRVAAQDDDQTTPRLEFR